MLDDASFDIGVGVDFDVVLMAFEDIFVGVVLLLLYNDADDDFDSDYLLVVNMSVGVYNRDMDFPPDVDIRVGVTLPENKRRIGKMRFYIYFIKQRER